MTNIYIQVHLVVNCWLLVLSWFLPGSPYLCPLTLNGIHYRGLVRRHHWPSGGTPSRAVRLSSRRQSLDSTSVRMHIDRFIRVSATH